jgi:hypothetical protein
VRRIPEHPLHRMTVQVGEEATELVAELTGFRRGEQPVLIWMRKFGERSRVPSSSDVVERGQTAAVPPRQRDGPVFEASDDVIADSGFVGSRA